MYLPSYHDIREDADNVTGKIYSISGSVPSCPARHPSFSTQLTGLPAPSSLPRI